MTKSRIVAILASAAFVLAAIIIAAIEWPELPARTTPPTQLPPANCLAVGRFVRIDDPHTQAAIVLDTAGGTLRTGARAITLSPAELRELTTVLASASCDADPARRGDRVIVVEGTQLPATSPIAIRVAAVFDAVRAR